MKPLPASHSALEAIQNCPRQYHEVKILKHFKDDKSEAALWGDRMHKVFETYLTGSNELPSEFETYRGYLDAILSVNGEMYVELKMAIDTLLSPCDFFAGRSIFFRGVCDVLHVNGRFGKAIDHKSGKRKVNSKQMRRMAILIFYHFKEVDEVKVAFMWLKEGKRDSETFKRSDLTSLWLDTLPDLKYYADTFAQDTWPPRQSGLCKAHCPVTSCEFNGRNR
jgi:PD-(D/E)XK nuclease superfamily